MNPTEETLPIKPRFPWLFVIFALPALVVLIGLGNWQLQRLEWKEDLLVRIETRMTGAPVPISSVAAQLSDGRLSQDDLEYRHVQLSGTYDHAGAQYFLATHKGISGFYVYTPLKLGGPLDAWVMVNRGFVPYDMRDPATRPASQPAGTVQLSGLARMRLAEKPSWIVPDNDPENRIYYWKDHTAMLAVAGIDAAEALPFFVDAGHPQRPGKLGTWPVDGVTRVNLPNNHLQYAITWYGLAAALILIAGLFVFRAIRSG